MRDVGLSECYETGFPSYGGASKNYYNCSHDSELQTARLCAMVVTAVWNAGCQLSYDITGERVVHG